MIEKKYCDITELRNFYQGAYETLFINNLVNKRVLEFGLADGSIKRSTIEPIFAITSQMQYHLKRAGVTVVSWWYMQHIVLAYLREVMRQGKTVTSANYLDFLQPISQVKTDQGGTAFSGSDIIQTLQTLAKFNSDPLIMMLYSVVPSGSGGGNNNYTDSNIINADQKTASGGISPVMIAAGLAAAFFMFKK